MKLLLLLTAVASSFGDGVPSVSPTTNFDKRPPSQSPMLSRLGFAILPGIHELALSNSGAPKRRFVSSVNDSNKTGVI